MFGFGWLKKAYQSVLSIYKEYKEYKENYKESTKLLKDRSTELDKFKSAAEKFKPEWSQEKNYAGKTHLNKSLNGKKSTTELKQSFEKIVNHYKNATDTTTLQQADSAYHSHGMKLALKINDIKLQLEEESSKMQVIIENVRTTNQVDDEFQKCCAAFIKQYNTLTKTKDGNTKLCKILQKKLGNDLQKSLPADIQTMLSQHINQELDKSDGSHDQIKIATQEDAKEQKAIKEDAKDQKAINNNKQLEPKNQSDEPSSEQKHQQDGPPDQTQNSIQNHAEFTTTKLFSPEIEEDYFAQNSFASFENYEVAALGEGPK